VSILTLKRQWLLILIPLLLFEVHSVSAKDASKISLLVEPLSLTLGEALFVKGELLPKHPNVTILVIYSAPDGSKIVHQIKTDNMSRFTDKFIPNVAGEWKVRAEWEGDHDHFRSSSNQIIILVMRAPSQLSLNVSSTELALGESIELIASLRPSVSEGIVTFQYRNLATNRWVNISKEAVVNGIASIVWRPSVSGEYELRALWSGSNTLLPSVTVVKRTLVKLGKFILNVTFEDHSFQIFVLSNVIPLVVSLDQQAKTLKFNLATGYTLNMIANITLPLKLLGGPYIVNIEGREVSYVMTTNETHANIAINYPYSTDEVNIIGATVIPEFPHSLVALAIGLTISLIILMRSVKQDYIMKDKH
jgi:hypothetical protein